MCTEENDPDYAEKILGNAVLRIAAFIHKLYCTYFFAAVVIEKENKRFKRRHLKVDGNEKLGGLRFLQLLGIGMGLWRSMSIFILNIPFANAKRISVSGHSSKMNRRLVCN